MGLITVLVVGGYLVFWTLTLSLVARRFLELSAGPLRLLLSGAAGVTVTGLTAPARHRVRRPCRRGGLTLRVLTSMLSSTKRS